MERTPVIEQQSMTGSLILNVENVGLTSDQFLQLCSDNRDLRFELTAQKELVIMPLPGANTSRRNRSSQPNSQSGQEKMALGSHSTLPAGSSFPTAPTAGPTRLG